MSIAVGDVNGDACPNGSSGRGKGDVSNLDLNYISVPVQYNVYLTRSKRLMIGAGGYASYLVSSKQTGRPVYEKMQTYDAGFMASGGVWINRHVLLQTGYQFGLVDMDGAGSNKARNGRTFLVLSYSFYSKVKYGPVITIKPKG